eukprot:scaffold23343_cov129-Isochrysis_galbana.AAC.1
MLIYPTGLGPAPHRAFQLLSRAHPRVPSLAAAKSRLHSSRPQSPSDPALLAAPLIIARRMPKRARLCGMRLRFRHPPSVNICCKGLSETLNVDIVFRGQTRRIVRAMNKSLLSVAVFALATGDVLSTPRDEFDLLLVNVGVLCHAHEGCSGGTGEGEEEKINKY